MNGFETLDCIVIGFMNVENYRLRVNVLCG
jgi:hypothetical protein